MYGKVITILIVLFGFIGCSSSNGDAQDTKDEFAPKTHDTNFLSTHFSGSNNCAICHNNIYDNSSNKQFIVNDWQSSMMANSSKDPLWRAKVKSELKRTPSLSNEINDKCSKCHTPMASIESKYNNDMPLIFGNGFLGIDNEYHDEALDGVSCTVCHQIKQTSTFGEDESMSGDYEIEHFTNAIDRKIYGQYQNPRTSPMRNDVSYTPTHSNHVSSSALCASCHNLKTPFADTTGAIVPNQYFPEQMPYTEWEYSDFNDTGITALSCKQCHMKQIGAGIKISSRPRNGLPIRDRFSKHTFLGANTYMMEVFTNNGDTTDTNGIDFESMIKKNRDFLRTSATIKITNKSIINNTLKIVIKIKNLSGHKLPTGYPSRRVYIHLKVANNNGIIFESGKTNTNGSIVNNNGDLNHNNYETHYKTITSQNQVQVYEAIMMNTSDEITQTLLRAKKYKKDNRLLPNGFDKANVPNDIAVKGLALNDDDFTSGGDTIVYEVDISSINNRNNIQIEAELNYQTVSYQFLQDLYKDNEINEVKILQKYLENNKKIMYERIAQDTTTI